MRRLVMGILLLCGMVISTSAATAVQTSAATAADAYGAEQTISRMGTRASATGPSEYFTGNVRVDPLFPANDTARYSGAYVTFEPGARSAWHVHPAGQHIVVTSGVGLVGTWGGPVEEVKAGDVIWCPPGIKHWHGASPAVAMTHLVVTGVRDDKAAEWMEKVTDEQYNAR
jgi:quercetin dioxygenase-like cupin family protein